MKRKDKHIIETSIGYYLSIKYHGNKRYGKKFHTIDYGTKEKALGAAIAERDKFVRENNLGKKRKYDSREIPGVSKSCIKGVWLWQATWTVNGKQKTKPFYINKFGEEKAFELAVKARRDGLNAIKNTATTSTLFLPPSPIDVKIWRYMDFTKFVSMLENGGLFFPNVELLNDYFEGSLSRGNERLRKFVYSRKQNKESMTDLIKKIKDIKKYILVNCWHMSDQESAAMWKLYAQSNEAICIQSTYRSLRKCLKSNFKIGVVKYIDYNKHWIPEDNIFYPFFYKRESFKHENELRAVIDLSDKNNIKYLNETSLQENQGIWVKINLAYFIRKIYVAPQSQNWFYNLVERISKKYGLDREVVKSSIDVKPLY